MKFPSLSFLVLIVVSIAVVSCKSTKPISISDTEIISDTLVNSKLEYHPSNPRYFDLLHTKLDVSFEWDKRKLNGIATLTAKPYFYSQDSLVLDSKGLDIQNVKLLEEDRQKELKFQQRDQKLVIQLGKKYAMRDTVCIEVEYSATPDLIPSKGSEAINSDKGLYFINPLGEEPYKPRQIWTQGETEANSKWFPTIDSPNEKSTQEMYITVDSSLTVLTNGEFVYSLANADGTKTEYWKMDKPHAPYLFMMAIGRYAKIQDYWNGKPVDYYVEPEYKKYAKGIFGNTPEMIGFFSDILKYPFPWNKYSQIVVRDYVSGAMENTTATIFMEALQIDDREQLDKNWDYIIAHELFHHWFGDLVTCESWSNLPLNESFANYSEYLWAEYKYGTDEADLHSEKEQEEYLQEAQIKQEPLIRFYYHDKEDMFDRHSYNKGGRILHMLRKEVGDEAFFTALNKYLSENKYSTGEVHQLRLAFEETTGKDMNWFFNQWFLNPGHPELEISQKFENGNTILHIQQTQDLAKMPVYKLNLNVEIWVNGVKSLIPIKIERADETFLIPSASAPDLLLVDPEFTLLGVKDHSKSKKEWIFQFRNSEKYINRKEALKALLQEKESPETGNTALAEPEIKSISLEGLNDPFWAIREYVLDQLLTNSLDDPEYFLKAVKKIATSDSKPVVRAKAIRFLSKYYGNPYRNIYEQALNEKAYSIFAAGLASMLKIDSTLDTNPYESINNLNVDLTLANHFVVTNQDGKYPWFKEKILRNLGKPRELYNFLFFFGEYSLRNSGADKQDAAEILKQIKNTNHFSVIQSVADLYYNKISQGN